MALQVTELAIWERLAAIEDIRCLKARYFRCVDTKLWPEFRALFTDDATLYFPEAYDKPSPISKSYPAIAALLDDAVSIHHGHMPEIEVLDADNARAIWSMEDEVFLPGKPDEGIPPSTILGAGHYHETYRREAGQWKIASLELTRLRHEVIQNPVKNGTGG